MIVFAELPPALPIDIIFFFSLLSIARTAYVYAADISARHAFNMLDAATSLFFTTFFAMRRACRVVTLAPFYSAAAARLPLRVLFRLR